MKKEELKKKLYELDNEIRIAGRSTLYLSIEFHEDYIDYLEMDKLISNKIEYAIKRDLKLKEEFRETFKNLLKFKDNKIELEIIYDEIENIGLDSKTLKDQLIELGKDKIGCEEDLLDTKQRIRKMEEIKMNW